MVRILESSEKTKQKKQYPAILPVGCNQLQFRKHFWPQFILFNLFAISLLFTFFFKWYIQRETGQLSAQGLKDLDWSLVTRFCSKQVNKTDRIPYSIPAHSCVDFYFYFFRDLNFNVWIIQYSATMFNRISKLRCTVKLQETVLQFQSILVHTFVIL